MSICDETLPLWQDREPLVFEVIEVTQYLVAAALPQSAC